MSIIIPIVAVTIIGIVCGVMLVVASKFMAVPEDETFVQIRECLPGANCGACGYAGCHDLAEALVKGEAKKVSLCKVGKADKNFEPIIQYLDSHPDEDGTKHVPTL